MKYNTLAISGILGFIAVILGALGAHALKSSLTVDQLNSFETGVRFQVYHALAILIVGLWREYAGIELLKRVIMLFTIGTILFSGSIYLLATRDITHLSVSWLGPITPIGGTVLIVGWGMLTYAGLKQKASS